MSREVDEVSPKKQGLIEREKAEHAANAAVKYSVKFQLMATLLVVACAGGGTLLGVILSNNDEVSDDLVSWVALPGDLFIRMLKCVILPLVFVNVIIAMIQMIEAGKAGKVGKYTILAYLATTFFASLEGLISVLIFESRFNTEEPEDEDTFFSLLCPTEDLVVAELEDKSLECVNKTDVLEKQTLFELDNINDFFVTSADDFESISFSETLQDGIFRKLVPENIVGEFVNGNFVGVVMFAVMMGAAAMSLARKPILLLDWLEDVNDILVRIIEWIIYLTPIAVFSLIAGALASQDDLAGTLQDIANLIAATLLAMFSHVLFVYPLLFLVVTRTNPYAYMRYLFPAQVLAFSSASSAATLPVTATCVKNSGVVPDSIRDFVLPIGATVNMDGTALYFPPAIIFLARSVGFESGAAEYFLILIISTIGSAGAAPVPSAGLVLIITAFNTVYGESGTPENFAVIVGIDWLMDRFRTALNVTGDGMVCRIVAFKSMEEELTAEAIVEGEDELAVAED